MKRTTLWLGGAALLVTGILADPARAALPAANVSNDAIQCGTVVATVQFRPALSFAGAATSAQIKIKGKLDGCVDTSNNGVTIDSGTFQGTLTGTSNDCLSLTETQSLTGSLTYRWQASKDTPISPTASVQAVNEITGVSFVPALADQDFAGASYIAFTLGTGAVTGAFTGGDAGASSHIVAATSENSTFFTASCQPTIGIKTLHLGLGMITLQ